MSIKDIEITVAGGNTEVRSAVCETIQNAMVATGFNDVTNTEAEADAEIGDTLMTQALAKYPEILSTSVTINAVTSEDEITESAIEAAEDEVPEEEPTEESEY